MDAAQTQYSVSEAAEALGVSVRTIRRRIKGGKLSVTKTKVAGREHVLIDGAELARWAGTEGLTMTVPGAADGPGGAPVTPGHSGTVGQSMTDPGGMGDSGGATVTELGAEVDRLRGQVGALSDMLEAVTTERDFLREVVRNLTTRALPEPDPTPAAARPSWWQRLRQSRR